MVPRSDGRAVARMPGWVDYDRMPLGPSVVDGGLWTGQMPRRAVVVLPVRSRRSTRKVLGCS
jgi:hypothetical protein